MAHVTPRKTSWLLVLLLSPFLWLMADSPAFAHDQLVSTTPTSGSSVAPPTLVRLTFSESVIPTGTLVQVKDPSQQVISSDLTVTGSNVSVRLVQPATDGKYRVTWRITSDDGHPVSGAFSFQVRGAASSSSGPSSSPGTSSPGVTSTRRTTSSNKTPAPTQQAPTNSTNNEPGWIIVATLVALAAIAVGVVVARRRLTDDEPTDGPADGDS